MNQRLELIVEATMDNRVYRLSLPFGTPYEDAFKILEAFKVEVETMQDNAKKQHESQQNTTSSDTTTT